MTGDKNKKDEVQPTEAQKDELRKLERAKGITKAPDPLNPVDGLGPLLPHRRDTEPPKELFVPITGIELMERWSVGWEAIFDFARQDKLVPYEPNPTRLEACVRYDFGMLSRAYTQEEREQYFSQWLYHPDDVEAFENQHEEILDQWREKHASSLEKQTDTERPEMSDMLASYGKTDPECYIESVSISYKNGLDIIVRVGNGDPKTYSYEDLGFRREDTKTWLAFIQILKSEDHLYYVGKAHGSRKIRNKQYDAHQQILRDISRKVVEFLNVTYKSQLPSNFHIFQRIHSERPGTYGPKFDVPPPSINDVDYTDYPKAELIAEIERLSEEKKTLELQGGNNSKDMLSQIMAKLEAAIEVASKKEFLGPNRIKGYLNPGES
ncbi:MAG: hypothetical protein JW743_12035 [Deltaproteobacteria bacterium]|nr:hypothetical protein [Deltaproteobacteria bacterium]MBN2845157.1 hypothetical protein [Deltaproteobacteria bacterium]